MYAGTHPKLFCSGKGATSIADIPRSMPDDVIRKVAAKGGVICINFHAGYLNAAAYEVYFKNRPKRDAEIKAVAKKSCDVLCGMKGIVQGLLVRARRPGRQVRVPRADERGSEVGTPAVASED